MVRVQRIDKCLNCEREFLNKNQTILEGINIEYNLIYCYKCVKNENKFNNF